MLLLPNKTQQERTSRMYNRTLAIYCFIDDLLKAMQHREDSPAEFAHSEVVTTAIGVMLFLGGNFERAPSFLHSSGMMPRMLARSRLSRRLSRLGDLLELVFHHMGLAIKELNLESRYSLDSFPIAVCDNIRISRCRLAQGAEFRGSLASKRRYFFGVRVQVISTVEGVTVEFSILPGSLSDIRGTGRVAALFAGQSRGGGGCCLHLLRMGRTRGAESEMACACLLGANATRRGAMCRSGMITNSGCGVALKRSLVKSQSCFQRSFTRRRALALS